MPVSWAASIIIGESTDTADVNDGFGTGEIVLGVRAYQWGWEYYYPRSIDLTYNVTPTYSSFVGNSLRYNYGSETTNTSNNFWRQYQKKPQDAPITPAHVIFNSLANPSVSSQTFLNDAGLDNLHASSAFPKIRNNTKIYNTHLLNLGTREIQKGYTLAEHYNTSTDPLLSLDYSINRPSNFLSSISYLNVGISNLNSKSFRNFLNTDTTNTSTIDSNSINHSRLTSMQHLPTTSNFLSLPSLSDSEDKILPTEQFIQQQKVFSPVKHDTNPTLSSKEHSLDSLINNLLSQDKGFNSTSFTFDLNYNLNLATRVFTSRALAPVLSSTSLRAENFTSVFDGTELNKTFTISSSDISLDTKSNPNTTVEANVGSIEKIPAPLIEMYWSTC